MLKKISFLFFLSALAFFAMGINSAKAQTVTNLTLSQNYEIEISSNLNNSILFCSVSGNHTVNINGIAMTSLNSAITGSTNAEQKVFYLLSPVSGINSVSTSGDIDKVKCFVVDEVNQTNPFISVTTPRTSTSGVNSFLYENGQIGNILLAFANSFKGAGDCIIGGTNFNLINAWKLLGNEANCGFQSYKVFSGSTNLSFSYTDSVGYGLWGDGQFFVELNKDVLPPAPLSNVSITNPAGSMSVSGNDLTVSGSCVSVPGYQTNQLVAGVGALLPIMPGGGNCNCFNNSFSCSIHAPKGQQIISVIDTTATENLDTLEVDFTGITVPNWLNYSPYIYTNVASSTTPISDPVYFKSNAGFTQSAVPLYFVFSPDVVASSTSLRFSIYDISGEFLLTVKQDYLSNLLIGNTYTANLNLSASTTRRFITVLEDIDHELKKDLITAIWLDTTSTDPVNIYDFGNYFPKLKNVLEKKILFRQLFQFYNGMTSGLAQIDAGEALKVNAHMISGDKEYNLVFPILDFTTPQILAFASPIRGVAKGFLIIMFGVWLLLRITRTLNI